ncbi:C4b-binding protein beta chain-like [Ptychodera flava]|uniref:C4b-binding protein beta chain-like n=1 Tax=Ptychodera flava TaxID=63121 RepID=UPI00396A70AC
MRHVIFLLLVAIVIGDLNYVQGQCATPAQPANGSHDGTVGGKTSDGSTLTYTCNPGYTLDGTAALVCRGRAFDPQDAPTCEADCTDPGDAPMNGQKTGTDYSHGSIVTYTCDEGYALSGPGELTCTSGSWDNQIPTCNVLTTAADTGTTITTESVTTGESGAGVARLEFSMISVVILALCFT